MTAYYVKSDNINILDLTLYSLDGSKSYDLSSQVLSFDIYEDIMFPCIRAEIKIIDAIGLLTSFPIVGEETIDIEFGQEGFSFTNSYTFHVKAIEQQKTMSQGKSKMYTLSCVSEEFITNSKQFLVSKYQGATDDVVRAIFNTTLQSKKTLSIGDPTKGTQNILLSRMRPLQAIDMLRKRAVSQDYISSSYVFFENKRGFNFCSIEYLLNQLQDNVNDKQFFYDTTQNTDVRNLNTRSLIDFKIVSQVNNTQKLAQGGLNNTVKRFDLLTGKVSLTQYINAEKQQQFKFASSNPKALNTSQFENKYGNTKSTALLVPHSSDLPENYIDSTIGARMGFVNKLSQNIFQAFTYGDIALTAGDIITINTPNPTGATDKPDDNRLINGNYIISRIRHIIINNAPNPKSYMVSMELIKGFYDDYA